MMLVTSIDGNTAGMDRAIAGPAHSNTTLRHLDRGNATKEVLHALKECARQAMRTTLVALIEAKLYDGNF